MNLLRKILFPLAILYGWVMQLRNFLFDRGILKSRTYTFPVIAVGNLSVGGTGKSPMIEYLIRLLSDNYQVATLSRGYKRKSQGFVLADKNASAETIGDEPFQFYSKFPKIKVAVDADRKNGIEKLRSQNIQPQVILLDDAYQHRKVKAGFYILLTSYDDLYADDFMLPAGNLREGRRGAKRADVIVVTKCPMLLSDAQQKDIRQKLKITEHQQLFFSTVAYDEFVYSESETFPVQQIKPAQKVLVAGIAKPKPFFAHLQDGDDAELVFPDHHHFTAADIDQINKTAGAHMIITTEKDYVRLKGGLNPDRLFYLPIQSKFLADQAVFDATIKDYVENAMRQQ